MIVWRLDQGLYDGVFMSGDAREAWDHVLAEQAAELGLDPEDFEEDSEDRRLLEQPPYRHPNPYEDGIDPEEWGGRVFGLHGFESLDQYYDWFGPRMRRALTNYTSTKLRKYEVGDDVQVGSAQVLFRDDKAELLDTFDPDHFDRADRAEDTQLAFSF